MPAMNEPGPALSGRLSEESALLLRSGELSPRQAAAFAEHIRVCSICHDLLEGTSADLEQMQALILETSHAAFRQKLLSRPTKRAVRFRHVAIATVSAAACAAAVFLLVESAARPLSANEIMERAIEEQ